MPVGITTKAASRPHARSSYFLLQLILGSIATMMAASGCDGSHAAATASVRTTVDRVIDGDTIVVSYHGKYERVRLIGMDTPETVDPDKPVGCYGQAASSYMKSILPAGTPIRLVFDVDLRDKYGRLLAYIYRTSDNLFVDADLVRKGYAVQLTIPPNVAHVDEFGQLAAQARQQGRGLWSACSDSASK